ncbi:MAG: HD domain-containing protein, partial [Deltaproteobacteria bacterium]|nr:HD domain-containing protein [Deltaproteobacteria bacterium]
MKKNSPPDLKGRIEKLANMPAMIAAVKAAGEGLYIVGGAVRDTVLGLSVNDIDLATTGPFEKTAELLARAFGKQGIMLGRPPKPTCRFALPGLNIDLSPAEGGTIEIDLKRRDLTINAMALELRIREPRIIDPGDGLGDLDKKAARFVSSEVVQADPLRLLRLFRFSADLSLTPDPHSLDLIKTHAALIQDVPGERIREELLKLMALPHVSNTVKSMLDSGLLLALMPELEPLQGCGQNYYHHLDVLDHSLLALSSLEQIMAEPGAYFPEHTAKIQAYLSENSRAALLKIIALLHDLGKPRTRSEDEDGRLRFFGHEEVGEEMAARIASRFRLANHEKGFICFIIRHHLRVF